MAVLVRALLKEAIHRSVHTMNSHYRRRKPRPAHKSGPKPAEGKAGATASEAKSPPAKRNNRTQRGRGRSGAPVAKSRWFYDVRQYAILTDADNNILILQLPKEYDAAAANTWTLPGGKLEPSDEPGEGLLREITEETGLPATLLGPCGVARWTNRNSKKLGIFYRASIAGSKPALKLSNEHQRAIWVSLSEITDFPFHRPEMVEVIKKIST